METGKVLRTTGWIIGGFAGALAIGWLALLAINRSDEAPSAAAVRLASLSERPRAVSGSGNAHVHLAGSAAGHADRRAARSAGVVALVRACTSATACEDALRAHPDALADWQATEPELLEHYARVLAADAWQPPVAVDPSAPVVDFSAALDAQGLHLLTARQRAIAGDAGAVRAALDQDLVFWRRVMAASDLLITRMVAVAAVERHFQLGQLALRELPASSVSDAIPASWARSLTEEERSLVRPLAGEWRMVRAGVMSAIGPEAAATDTGWITRLAGPLLQPQATLNLFADNMVELATLSTLPYPELANAVRERLDTPDPAGIGFSVYNPIGRALAGSQATAAPAYADYVARTADLEGLRRASWLVAMLRAQGLQPGAVRDALLGARLRNPYDDAPFAWDASAGAVVFEGLAQGGRGRHAVPL